MAHTYSSILLHAVWSTKERKTYIDDTLKFRLHGYMRRAFELQNTKVLALNGMPDHVHVLLSTKPTTNFSDLMRGVKTASSKWVKSNFPSLAEFAWQDGYGAFSVGLSTLKNVQNYIANQELHHATKSYEDEFIEFLEAHQIQYDKKFIFL